MQQAAFGVLAFTSIEGVYGLVGSVQLLAIYAEKSCSLSGFCVSNISAKFPLFVASCRLTNGINRCSPDRINVPERAKSQLAIGTNIYPLFFNET